jgi:ketosteroid isomerase-like protein
VEDPDDAVDPVDVVRSFNGAINARDLEALTAQMTDTHRFIDAAGGTVEGKRACVEAWRGFFAGFPDYRNVFEDVTHVGDGVVVVRGRSECSDPALDGPARWRAVVESGRVDVWHVTDVAPDA